MRARLWGLSFAVVMAGSSAMASPCKDAAFDIAATAVQCALSPVCTAGSIDGNPGPLRHATTFFVLTAASPAADNPPGCFFAGFWCKTDYAGLLFVTTEDGSATFADQGTVDFTPFFDGQTPTFSESDQLLGGTGGFSTATGGLSISGAVSLFPTLGFTGQGDGNLCMNGKQR